MESAEHAPPTLREPCWAPLLLPGDETQVRFAYPRRGLVVEARQKCITLAARHRRRLVQERAVEDDSAAQRRLVGLPPELGKAQRAAVVFAGVEVDCHGKPAVCRAAGRVIAVGPEESTLRAAVTRDDVALGMGRI